MLLLALVILGLTPGVARATPSVLVIGDSLAAQSEAHLRERLPGWRVRQRFWPGVRLGTGMGWLGEEHRPPRILAFSLFSNDPPEDVARLERNVAGTLARHPGCHVWATLYARRPHGNPYAAANRMLRRLRHHDPDRLVLVDWAAEAVRSPELVAGDGVHGTPRGAEARGALFAEAARSCHQRLLRAAAEAPPQLPAMEDRARSPVAARGDRREHFTFR